MVYTYFWPTLYNHRGARGTSTEVGNRIPPQNVRELRPHYTTPHPQVSVILVCRRYCLVEYDQQVAPKRRHLSGYNSLTYTEAFKDCKIFRLVNIYRRFGSV
jgi:hypothetical protein